MKKEKSSVGRFFEDYELGETIRHATPRTLTEGDRSLYIGIYSSRYTTYCSSEFAKEIGFKGFPLEDLLVFHTVFGKTVPDISLNAIANLGYAEVKFLRPVFPNDTIFSESEVIGLKENSNKKTGIVYVRTRGFNQNRELVLEFIRWVMLKKKVTKILKIKPIIPDYKHWLEGSEVPIFDGLSFESFNYNFSGEKYTLKDYVIGEKIVHAGSVTLDETEHILATRLWQNTSKVHFDINQREDKRRLIYGGHIISMGRAFSFNGLANAQVIMAINSGSHTNPSFAGDTLSFWSEILDKYETKIPGYGLIRLRLIGCKGVVESFDIKDHNGIYNENIVLDLDYWAAIPT